MADEQKKITELTPEQEEKMKEYRQRGIDKGLNTEQIGNDEIQKIVEAVYTNILKKDKVPVKVYDSPKAAWQAVIDHTGLKDKDYIHPYLEDRCLPSRGRPIVHSESIAKAVRPCCNLTRPTPTTSPTVPCRPIPTSR